MDFQEIVRVLTGRRGGAEAIKAIITVLTLMLTLGVAGQAVLSSTSPDNSSKPPAPTPGYVMPDAATQVKLNEIRSEVYFAVNKMRTNAGVGNVFEYNERVDAAKSKAELNAVTGREDQVDEGIGMLQQHLPLDQASGWQFIENFRNSQPHSNVLLDPRYLHMAVGTAYGKGQVWLVIQFET